MWVLRQAFGIADRAAAALFPGYFALVMATGALSIASELLGYHLLAAGLLGVNILAYGTLAALLGLRLCRHFGDVLHDVADHSRGAGFFTVVAGTCVFGSQLVVVGHLPGIACWFWVSGLVLWTVVMYSFFLAVTIRRSKPSLQSGINGAWLIAAVATQSIAVLGSLVAPSFAGGSELVLFVAFTAHLLGAMLYLAIITLIFYRLTFIPLTVEDMTPPYWISMGAVAISTLAGASLILRAPDSAFLLGVTPFLRGFTLFFWATATWWIPLLALLMAWRHLYMRHPIRYEPQFWGMVFPLAMYTTATVQLARAERLDFLMVIPEAFVFVALAAWLMTAFGLLRALRHGLHWRRGPATNRPAN